MIIYQRIKKHILFSPCLFFSSFFSGQSDENLTFPHQLFTHTDIISSYQILVQSVQSAMQVRLRTKEQEEEEEEIGMQVAL